MVGLPGFVGTLVRLFKSDTSRKVCNLELSLISKTEIRSKKSSLSSQSLRMKIINLDFVSMVEIEEEFSRSRLEASDQMSKSSRLVLMHFPTVWSVYSLPIGRSWRNKSLLHYY